MKCKQEAEEQRAQRIQQKEAKKRSVQSKKRVLKDDEGDQPRKRVRITVSLTRNAGDSRDSSVIPNTRMVKQSTRTILDTERSSEVIHQDTQSEELISHSERSRRAVRLLTRFR